jgi:hypothetical protein
MALTRISKLAAIKAERAVAITAHLKIRVLEERLRQQRIRMLASHSEMLANLQSELLADQEPSATGDEVEARREPITRRAVGRVARESAAPRKSNPLPRADLPRC